MYPRLQRGLGKVVVLLLSRLLILVVPPVDLCLPTWLLISNSKPCSRWIRVDLPVFKRPHFDPRYSNPVNILCRCRISDLFICSLPLLSVILVIIPCLILPHLLEQFLLRTISKDLQLRSPNIPCLVVIPHLRIKSLLHLSLLRAGVQTASGPKWACRSRMP